MERLLIGKNPDDSIERYGPQSPQMHRLLTQQGSEVPQIFGGAAEIESAELAGNNEDFIGPLRIRGKAANRKTQDIGRKL